MLPVLIITILAIKLLKELPLTSFIESSTKKFNDL